MNINELTLSTNESSHIEIEDYLIRSITNYGRQEIKGETPFKLYHSYKNKHNKYVAGIMGSITKNMLFISHLFVEKNYRNQGIGHMLLKSIENQAKKQNVTLIRLNTLNNKTASLYTDSGYEITTHIKDYIKGFDLVYYHKSIS